MACRVTSRWVEREPGSWWLLHPAMPEVPVATVQQFYADGPFYGGWIKAGFGWQRTGPMTDFGACQRKVEQSYTLKAN
jgi:hypothetical protein